MFSILFMISKYGFHVAGFIISVLITISVLKDWIFLNCMNYLILNNHVDEFDYVIVGSGSAASTVALRLSENKNYTVLVLEAGPYGHSLIDIPSLTPLLQKSFIDWQFKTVPQEHGCWALQNNISNWPMGRVFGGTSRLNNMIYSRGHPNDFKGWFKEDSDYTYKTDILPYFLKAENQIGRYKTSKFHSIKGPLYVEDLHFTTLFAKHFIEAVSSLNYRMGDLNGHKNTGFMEVQGNTKSGSRWTPGHELYFLKKSNVNIKTNSFVEEILLKNNFEAYGVKYNRFGVKREARAKRGVVLSAGVIGSPKLLMLSGIGPKKHLETLDIPLKIDLPVGYNLQDHVTTGLDLIILNQTAGLGLLDLISPLSALRYFVKGEGPWTSTGCEVIGVIDTKITNKTIDNLSIPDLQLMILPAGITGDFGAHLRYALNLKNSVWTKYFERLLTQTTVSVIPVLLHPKSRGRVYLKDKNPYSEPLINPNYLSESEDVEVLLKGIKLIKKIVSEEPLQKLGAKLNEDKFPGCEMFPYDSREYWECYVRHFTLTSYHPVGTCSLGSVVDYNFKVKNTNKLFVVDGSILPSLTSANVNAAIVMMAEKASDVIKKDDELSLGKCNIIEIFLKPKKKYFS